MLPTPNHEWTTKYKWIAKCEHCDCTRIAPDAGDTTYYPGGLALSTTEEPPCLTKKENKGEQ